MAITPRYQRFEVPVGKAIVAEAPTTPDPFHWIARIHLKNVSLTVVSIRLYINDGAFSDDLLPGSSRYILAPGDLLVVNGILFPAGTKLEAEASLGSSIIGKVFYAEQEGVV
jgi:hypothetical protein